MLSQLLHHKQRFLEYVYNKYDFDEDLDSRLSRITSTIITFNSDDDYREYLQFMFRTMSKTELQAECELRGLSKSGTIDKLLERLGGSI